MRRWLATGALLGLGLVTARGWADDVPWHAAGTPASRNTAWNSTGKPAVQSAPVVTLSRPVPIRSTAQPAPDPAIRPVFFEAAPIARASANDGHSPDTISALALVPPPSAQPRTVNTTEDIPVRPNPLSTGYASESFLGGAAVPDADASPTGDPLFPGPFTGSGIFRGHMWASAEYLLWAVRGANAPPLLTTGPTGVLGQPGTSDLWDQNNLPRQLRSGGRFTAGFWLPWYTDIGLEASYFFLGQATNRFSASSLGTPILARPFTAAVAAQLNGQNYVAGQNYSVLTAYPGFATGSFGVNSSSYLWGVEMNARKKLCCGCCGYLDLLVGYRHFDLQDRIFITDVETHVSGTEKGTTSVVTDNFSTRNQFNGGQIGLDGQWNLGGRWFIGGTVKVAVGNVRQVVAVDGTTDNSIFGMPINHCNSGLLALSSNSGTFARNRFAVLPATTLKLGYYFTPRWRIWVGYDFLYISNVVRAGDQIDLRLNPSLFPTRLSCGSGIALPPPPFNSTGFWAQGASFGMEYRW